MMLQMDEPDDFVISTGEAHSVREFVELAFKHIGREIMYVACSGAESQVPPNARFHFANCLCLSAPHAPLGSWEGKGMAEVGKERESGVVRVRVNEKYFRPAEVVS